MIAPQRQPGKFDRSMAQSTPGGTLSCVGKRATIRGHGRNFPPHLVTLTGKGNKKPRLVCCPRTGAKNCVEEPKFNDDGNWW